MTRYRVVQWATGNIGQRALRAVLDRETFELVGVHAFSSDKVGRDAGELAGVAPVGVLATDDVDALISTASDCVIYTPHFIDYALIRIGTPHNAELAEDQHVMKLLMVSTAMAAVNAVPYLCEAPAGVITPIDLPVTGTHGALID